MEKVKETDPAAPLPVRLACRVSYLGTRFYGSQQQESSRTVEGEFIEACRRLALFSDWRTAGFASAGRTDRGVHACGQVIAFSTQTPDRARQALNSQLPPDIWCTATAVVPDHFHPRYDARSRTYRYYFGEPPRDPVAMETAAREFSGDHNFTNFARVGDKNPWRKILEIRIGTEGSFTYLEVKAQSFLWHQVRCMAAAALSAGMGEQDADGIRLLLNEAASRPIQPAPAEGLVLWDTDCGLTWDPVGKSPRSCTYCTELRRHHALMEQVCRVLGPE
ncbi:tRNA pseudouridine synthase A [Methanoregula boonei 6A8]|jgi:tRNA pseudouridine38-40 synthase|uniref:tRNA pseudouridine synthase A n=1 Tax=Methanoregula boonei (strain DSM 21154 / JCM 14090 / 6A8) TaxID=456442 RepID=A7I4S8_METB6|nr:tRNA pseudouridine(38-40) synthase TruA [Methanoregula boonei]ABS54739.1 tRNA pseudouridine synthase A [Methanoregula boonei 6A8]